VAVTAVVALLVAAGFVQEFRRLDRNDRPEDAEVVRAAAAVARLTGPENVVATDLPIVPHLAGRRSPGPLVDTSVVRVESGDLSAAEIAALLDRYDVRAVVVGRAFSDEPDVLAEIAERFRPAARHDGITIYVR
jgi:hypothetical protein